MRLIYLILISTNLLFADEIKIEVTLNPAGSFVASSKQLKAGKFNRHQQNGFLLSGATLALESLGTGIELRDAHMKENYFEVQKYPQAELYETVGKGGHFKGKLRLHGVTKEIRGDYELTSQILKAQFFCRLSDFKIKKANYRGIGVEDQVKVTAEISTP